MTWGAVAVAGAGLVSGMMSADAAGDAADQQSQSAANATAAQERANAQMRADLAPWTSTGAAAQNKLATYLGTSTLGNTGTVNGLQSGLTRDQVREQLLSQYTKPSVAAPAQTSAPANLQYGGDGDSTGVPGWYDQKPAAEAAGQVDEAGLNAAIEKYYADQATQEKALQSDPNYGSLLKSYKDGADFKFDATDLQNEAGYQFGLDQGMKGIDRAQASRGNFLSGAAIKESTRYAQDYAGTKANEAYARQAGTWGMNKAGFDSNRNSIYNFLTGQSTIGQNAAARVGTNNQQTANSAAENMMASGTAQAAGTIAGSNALASAFNRTVNTANSSSSLNGAAGWNTLLASNNIGRSGNNYNGSSWLPTAANYENSMDRGNF